MSDAFVITKDKANQQHFNFKKIKNLFFFFFCLNLGEISNSIIIIKRVCSK